MLPDVILCILVGVHCLDRVHDSTALKFPTGILHGPRHAAQADPKLGRNNLCSATERLPHRIVPLKLSPETLMGLDTYKHFSPQKTHSSFPSTYALSAM